MSFITARVSHGLLCESFGEAKERLTVRIQIARFQVGRRCVLTNLQGGQNTAIVFFLFEFSKLLLDNQDKFK